MSVDAATVMIQESASAYLASKRKGGVAGRKSTAMTTTPKADAAAAQSSSDLTGGSTGAGGQSAQTLFSDLMSCVQTCLRKCVTPPTADVASQTEPVGLPDLQA